MAGEVSAEKAVVLYFFLLCLRQMSISQKGMAIHKKRKRSGQKLAET